MNRLLPGTTRTSQRERPAGNRSSTPLNVLDHAINARDHIHGSPTAPVTLLEYGDYERPECGQAHFAVKELQRCFGEQLRVAFRNFALNGLRLRAQHAAEAAEAAGAQRRFWEMHDLLFQHQERLSDRHLRLYATQVGLDMARFNKEMVSQAYAVRVREDLLSGVRSGVKETPTFFINGVRYSGLLDVESLRIAIERAA